MRASGINQATALTPDSSRSRDGNHSFNVQETNTQDKTSEVLSYRSDPPTRSDVASRPSARNRGIVYEMLSPRRPETVVDFC